MQASEYFAQIQTREHASTIATCKPSAEDIRRATGSDSVDYRVEQATERE
jgi:hypothetical protein